MTKILDLEQSVIALKNDERMIGFAGFMAPRKEDGPGREGVLKISSFCRPEGSGFLTLTFIVDTENDQPAKTWLIELFERITQDSLRPHLGREMETLVSVPLDYLMDAEAYFFSELNVYFRSLSGRERELVTKKLLPALKVVLECTFEPVEWLDQEPPSVSKAPVPRAPHAPLRQEEKKVSGIRAIKEFLRKYL